MRMPYPRRILLFLLLVFISQMVPAAAASLTIEADSQYRYAEFLYAQGSYASAAAEYQRFAYFFPEDPRNRNALFNAGTALLHAGDHASAIPLLRSLSDTRALDEVAVEAYFMLVEAYLQTNEQGQAVLSLHNLIALAPDHTVADRAYYRIGWIRIDQLDWETARQAFHRLSDDGRNLYRIDELSRALDERQTLPTKNPALAGVLSIVPGAGQLYNGRYEDALAAFVVDIGLIWASYESFDQDLNVLGTLLAIVGAGFYASNIYGAVSSAHKYNQSRQLEFVEQLNQRLRVTLGPSSHSMGSGSVLTLQLKF